MQEVRNTPDIKKVTVTLENGKTLEFDKQFVLFAQDEMSATERCIRDNDESKICGIVHGKMSFLASVACSMLETLNSKTDGIDKMVIMKHLEKTDDTVRLLADLFGQ